MSTRPLRRVALLVALLALAACDSGGAALPVPTAVPASTPAPRPTHARPTVTPAPTAISLDSVRDALQTVVDLERRAVESQSKDAFMAQIDAGDREWKILEAGEFDSGDGFTDRLTCVANVRFDAESLTAQADVGIDDCPGRYHVGMFFRRIDGRWVHSQPALTEQGLRDTKQIGPFRVTFHAMDASYLPDLERFAPMIYDRVSTVMDMRQLNVDVDLVSRPSDMPRSAFTTIALYDPLLARMSVLSPFFWPNGDGTEVQLDDQIRTTLTHEFTHHAVRTAALLAVPHWLNEGMAVYVGGENPTRYVRDIEQLASVSRLQPPEALDHLLLDGATAEISYAEGYSFVQFLTARQGDSVLPKLLHALAQTNNLDTALRSVTGKGLAAWWKAWLAGVS
jgi:hypothetical protein